MSDTSNRQAGAEIEITPAMIDAGVEVLLREIGLAKPDDLAFLELKARYIVRGIADCFHSQCGPLK